MRIFRLLAPAVLPLALIACGSSDEGESSDDFAARLGSGAATTAADVSADVSGQPGNPALADLPQPAANAKQAVAYDAGYRNTAADGSQSGLTIMQDGTFTLVENDQTVQGKYDWLPDGKRLRLNGVSHRPIVLIADGAIYRLTNEDVPLNDLTPDRMYTQGGE